MTNLIQAAFRYLSFRLKAKKKFHIHSPFVYSFYSEVLSRHSKISDNSEIEKIKSLSCELFARNEQISVPDTGGKSYFSGKRKLGKKVQSLSQTHSSGIILHRCVRKMQPKNIIELGTGAGIGTLYMSSANPLSFVYTIEGNPVMADIAAHVFQQAGYSNIQLNRGLFSDLLPELIKNTKAEMIFIDGDHTYNSLLHYYNLIKPHITERTVIVLHDIYWSSQMMNAWKEICSFNEVRLSIDTYFFGFLFFSPDMPKQHFLLAV